MIAERLEQHTIVEFRLLRGLGCDFGQGYHFARPVPVEQILDRLEPPDFVATVVEPDESVPVLVDVGQAGAVPGE